jgi:hypothetical protein
MSAVQAQCELSKDDKPVPKPRPQLPGYSGVVTEVDATSITLRGFGANVHGAKSWWQNETGSVRVWSDQNTVVEFPDYDVKCAWAEITRTTVTMISATGDMTILRRADQMPRRFLFDPVLASGGFHPDALPGGSFRRADVQIGDEVSIRLSRERIDGLCYEISIQRRPGGRVPEPPVKSENPRIPPFHERMNAYQDFEEKGIPIPDKYQVLVPAARKALPPIPPAPPPRLKVSDN